MSMMSATAPPTTGPTATIKPPVVLIHDIYEAPTNNAAAEELDAPVIHQPAKKRAKTSPSSAADIKHGSGGNENKKPPQISARVFHPTSPNLLDDMLHPLSRADFLKNHFRKDAVHVQRRPKIAQTSPTDTMVGDAAKAAEAETNGASAPMINETTKAMVSDICENYLFGLDVRKIFEETSSENVFLWLRPTDDASSSSEDNNGSSSNNKKLSSTPPPTLNSVEMSDPSEAFSLHTSGSHPAYCRAPPPLESALVSSLLRATGLGGGHYHPPHEETVTIGGGTTLGRGEVELFVGASSAPSSSAAASPAASQKQKNQSIGHTGIDNAESKNTTDNADPNSPKKGEKHTTGWHTDFQENFTIQLSGIKRWTLRRGRVKHPLRATTPHYKRDASVVENQLKLARLCCLGGHHDVSQSNNSATSTFLTNWKNAANDTFCDEGPYGFEYNDNNTLGPEQTITLYPGDVLYFPSGMWHRVETLEPGISLNVSLMGTTYATLVCEALEHLMVKEEAWREVVCTTPGQAGQSGEEGADRKLQKLLGGLGKLVEDFVENGGGAQSILPPALCYPPLGLESDIAEADEGNGDEKSAPLDEEAGDGAELFKEASEDKMEDVLISNEEEEHGKSGGDTSIPIWHGQEPVDENDEDGKEEWVEVEDGDNSDDDEDAPLSGIIVSMDDFEGPEGWTCTKPLGGKLIKNPLASLISMDDIADSSQNPNADTNESQPRRKQYVLNVNFAGNEMMESHVRIILETTDLKTVHSMEWYLKCEASGESDAGGIYNQIDPPYSSVDNNGGSLTAVKLVDENGVTELLTMPPSALFYYGYFLWKPSKLSESDIEISNIINSRKHWPPMQKRITLFDSDKLTRVRLHKSNQFPHERVSGDRKACTLCPINRDDKRSTLTSCSVCKIPLCTRLIGSGTTKTCFQLWHEREDLAAAHLEQSLALRAQRDESRAAGRFEHARTVRKKQKSEKSESGPADGEELEEKKGDDDERGNEKSMQEAASAAAAVAAKTDATTVEGEEGSKESGQIKMKDDGGLDAAEVRYSI